MVFDNYLVYWTKSTVSLSMFPQTLFLVGNAVNIVKEIHQTPIRSMINIDIMQWQEHGGSSLY
ncbi:hypothetical protein WS68_10830 [Burkholderia sp. TSV86]|nr:hypothetical protein WS68_10830 [Burkholderia sp. TSV86]